MAIGGGGWVILGGVSGLADAIEENHLRVSEVVGTSGGAIAAAEIAGEYSADEIYEINANVQTLREYFSGKSLKEIINSRDKVTIEPIIDELSQSIDAKRVKDSDVGLGITTVELFFSSRVDQGLTLGAVALGRYVPFLKTGRTFYKEDLSTDELKLAIAASNNNPFAFSHGVKLRGKEQWDGGMDNQLPLDGLRNVSEDTVILGVKNKFGVEAHERANVTKRFREHPRYVEINFGDLPVGTFDFGKDAKRVRTQSYDIAQYAIETARAGGVNIPRK